MAAKGKQASAADQAAQQQVRRAQSAASHRCLAHAAPYRSGVELSSAAPADSPKAGPSSGGCAGGTCAAGCTERQASWRAAVRRSAARLQPLARLLLHIGCNANGSGSDGEPALLHAVHGGSTEAVAALLEAGVAPNPPAEPAAQEQPAGGDGDSSSRESEGGSRHPAPLIAAAKAGHAGIVRLLLEAGADPALPDSPGGCTSLWLAADRGRSAIVELLLQHGPPELADRASEDGATPLMQAAGIGDAESMRLLLDHGAMPNRQVHAAAGLYQPQPDSALPAETARAHACL